MADKPVIFISYSHLDEPEHPRADEVQWLTFVQRFLRPAVKDGRFEVWVDRHMGGGADWDPEIEAKLRECDVFVLLVSTNSMASNYVIDKEIAIIRERQANGENVHFYPIVLTPTPKAGLDKVNDKNLGPRDGKPLSGYAPHDRMQHMSDIADEIAAIVVEIAKAKAATALKKRAPVAGVKVEIGGLPETPYVNLVGRDGELRQLDAAWGDPQINIVSLVAEGGAGKSSLLNEWLVRLQARGYEGAEVVLGWSFYSQGSKERATSAEGFLSWAVNELNLAPSSNAASAKGTAIAEALAGRRVLLALDGVEPLQHGPGPELGKLKDDGLRELLRRVATTPPSTRKGLVVLTTRTPVSNIERWRKTSAPVIELDKLSDEAGVALLKDNGVWGTTQQLTEAVQAFHGHALALSLLAGFLRETQNGDVRRRDHVRQIANDDDDPRHAHAKRVIKSYADEWLAKEPVLDAIMAVVGLFDRPADAGCLGALRQAPAVRGLTDAVVTLGRDDWNKAITRLRAARLLLPSDPEAPDALDAHPLVREWFGERLKVTNEMAWHAAHGRLYEHLRDATQEGEAPTLEQLGPLYQAIAHGCRAGRHQEALDTIYKDRICRRSPTGDVYFYARRKLGALGSDLAAISWFFDTPYAVPAAGLKPSEHAWVLAVAAYALSAQGRFAEAVPALRSAVAMVEKAEDWINAAIGSASLSGAELLTGEIAAAVRTAERSVIYADRGGDEMLSPIQRSAVAVALFAAGRGDEAAKVVADTESRQKKYHPASELLYSVRGYHYCDLLLAVGKYSIALERAERNLSRYKNFYSLLSVALDTLTLGRAYCLAASVDAKPPIQRVSDVNFAELRLDEAVDGLRSAGQVDEFPLGLLARARFRRSVGSYEGGALDLDEVEEIAEPGPMKLYLCDMALERARLAFAQIEAFAPLNGMMEKDNPPKPAVPSADEIEKLTAEAGKQIKIADEYIQSCGYHRRDEELAELKDVLAGKQKFADLPPRV